jgi:carbon-monoxide dehydrogenase medium subunit
MYTSHPAAFTLHRPQSVEEAVGLLDDDTRPLAGGHSLLPLMKLRLSVPGALVDLSRVSALRGIREEGDDLVVGAMTTHAELAASELVQRRCPLLAEAAGMIGDRQVRNRGTVGGSVAHADPAADYPTVLSALGATVTAAGPAGERPIAAADCFEGIFETALQPNELVSSVRVPATGSARGVYLKHRHPASRYAVVGVAAVVARDGGSCSRADVFVGGASAVPVRVEAARDLVGTTADEETIARVADGVPALLGDAFTDTYASGEYRRHLAKVMTRRALQRAFGGG